MNLQSLPSGGPFELSQQVSAAVFAHLEVLASDTKNHGRKARHRDKVLAELSERDRALLRIIGNAVVCLGSKVPAPRRR